MWNAERINDLLDWAWGKVVGMTQGGEGVAAGIAMLPKAAQAWLPDFSCEDLAREYRDAYETIDEAIAAFIRWQCAQTGAIGFAAGMPGLVIGLVAVAPELALTTVIQLRMVATIAILRGWDVNSSKTKTMSLYALLGTQAAGALAALGSEVAIKLATKGVGTIPGKVLIEINKAVGMRLLTKFGKTGMIRVASVVPIIGGMASGGINAFTTYNIGWAADRLFKMGGNKAPRSPDDNEDGMVAQMVMVVEQPLPPKGSGIG